MRAKIIEHEFLHAIGIYHTQVNDSEQGTLLELLRRRRYLYTYIQKASDSGDRKPQQFT